MMRTKDRVRSYRERHPTASLREIQRALGISSPSVVKYHIDTDTKAERIAELDAALLSLEGDVLAVMRDDLREDLTDQQMKLCADRIARRVNSRLK